MLASLDLTLFKLINQTYTHELADRFFITITDQSLLAVPFLFLVTFLLFFNARRGRILLVLLILTVGLTDSISYRVLKPAFKRERPCHAMKGEVRELEKCGGKFSMPSNHAANLFAAAMLLSLFFRRGRWYFFTFAFLSGAYARVYVGKHYPGDVLAGAVFGIILALIIYYIWVMLRVRLEKQNKYYLSI